jgi:phage-related baseplate assembly protein
MALKEPIFVETDPAAILTQVLEDYTAMSGKILLPAQPEYIIASCIAYHKALTMNRINETGKAMLVDFSAAPVLDYLAALFNITRLPAQGAVCTLGFDIVPGHMQVVIPLGTRISSSDGNVIFATDDDITVPVGTDYVEITATCETTGTAGRGYKAGDINQLMDPYAYISAVNNTDITAGGSDEESDTELRNRIKLATSQYSVAGSRNAYIFWSKSAAPSIVDIAVATYEDDHNIPFGEVDIYALLKDGQLPTPAINDKILSVLSDETIRPLTDTVKVKTPSAISYSLTINVVKYPDASPSLTNVLYSKAFFFGEEKKQKLGLDIVETEIEALCRVPGVYDVSVTILPTGKPLTGRNLIVSPWEVAILDLITINITGTNAG